MFGAAKTLAAFQPGMMMLEMSVLMLTPAAVGIVERLASRYTLSGLGTPGDASRLAAQGYSPIAQSWGEGRAGAARVFMIGEFANTIRPNGYLTVTYKLGVPAGAEHTPAAPDPIEQIRRLGELRDAGLVTDAEYEAKRLDLLGRI
jgi:putative oligomerization/nucleic acid binding protein